MVVMLLKELRTIFTDSQDVYGYIHCSFWKAWLWQTSASLCKNENGAAELQAIVYILIFAKTRMGKDVVQGIEQRKRVSIAVLYECP